MFKTTTSSFGLTEPRGAGRVCRWLATLAVVGLGASARAQQTTIVDTNSTGATNDNSIGATEYAGSSTGSNIGGGSCFGGQIGSGVKTYVESDSSGNLAFAIEDTATTTCAFSTNATDTIVIYIDSKSGGFANTTGFNDQNDQARKAVSGKNGTNHADITFATGFTADYAIVADATSVALFTLANGNNLSLTFVKNLTKSSTWDWTSGSNSGCIKELTGFTMSDIGSTAGGSFDFVVTMLDASTAYRSCEWSGVTSTTPTTGSADANGNYGTSDVTLGARNFIRFRSYTPCVRLQYAGIAATQNFDTLISTGTATASSTGVTDQGMFPIVGWYMLESGSSKNLTYTAGTGSANTGDTYIFGASGSTDRALGGLQSGSVIPTLGACFTNHTGYAISGITISYTGEQWRIGNNASNNDKLDFQYSTSATALNSATWTDDNNLDLASPNTTSTAGALDGNATANRASKTDTITMAVADGATFWIRWNDFNATSSDDGLSIDDFSISTTSSAGTDYGDAPASYGSGDHTIGGPFLGAYNEDAEASAPDGTGTTDDTTGVDDEDTAFPTSLYDNAGSTSFPVTVTGSGFLSVFVDWNKDGDFLDVGEKVVAAQAVSSATTSVSFTVPDFATSAFGTSYARLRIAADVAWIGQAIGNATTGEVEDYQVTLLGCGDHVVNGSETCDDDDTTPTSGDGCSATCTLETGWTCTAGNACTCDTANGYQSFLTGCFKVDRGDAPSATYGTAAHAIGGPFIGTNATDGEASYPANGDGTQDDTTGTDDEDNAVPATFYASGTSQSFNVVLSAAAKLDVYADWNRSSGFEASEKVAFVYGSAGTKSVGITVPSNASFGASYIRLRVSTAGTTSATADAADGEVEDYPITIIGCGDQRVNGSETCDDDDVTPTSGDGCSSTCTLETGWACTAGNACTCASGYVDPNPSDATAECQLVDFGDAPDTYGTLLASDGARHLIVASGPKLGSAVTSETDGKPGASANLDSDDGFVNQNDMHVGETGSVGINVTKGASNGVICTWVDWNHDGAFTAAEFWGESQFNATGQWGSAGAVPASAVAGATVMRARVMTGTTCTTSAFKGLASDGEVEDYIVNVSKCGDNVVNGTEACDDGDAGGDGCTATCTKETNWTCPAGGGNCSCNAPYYLDGTTCTKADFGDLPNTYGTTLASNGARHWESGTGPILGFAASYETNGTASATASADSDDDAFGPSPSFLFIRGQTVDVTYHVLASGSFEATLWVDWNADGVFDETERVLDGTKGDSVKVFTGSGSNDYHFVFTVPATVGNVTATGMRVRIATNLGTPSPLGSYADGEVEDYVVQLSSCGDGVVDAALGETCDQGGATGSDANPPSTGDGCDASCHTEEGFTCTGAPSVCSPTQADVAVTAFAFSPTAGYSGAATTLTATVQNGGPATANNVTLVFDRPASTILVPGDLSATGCTLTGSNPNLTITCTAGTLTASAFQTFTLPFTVATSPSAKDVSLSVLSLTSSVGDPDLTNNEATAAFTARYCGDSAIQAGNGEACDDGNKTSTDGCSSACAVESGFQCTGQPSTCAPFVDIGGALTFNPTHAYQSATSTMTWQVINTTGKSANQVTASITKSASLTYGATISCLDGGTALPSNTCSQNASTVSCSYGNVATGKTLSCSMTVTVGASVTSNVSQTVTIASNDPKNVDPSVTASLEVDYCGDGTSDAGHEECDSGTANNNNQPNHCRATCVAAKCGDGILDAPGGLAETCEQGGGNVATGDGCDAACQTESGWQCTGTGANSCVRIIDLSAAVSYSPTTVYGTASTTMTVTITNNNSAAAATNVTFSIAKSAEANYGSMPSGCNSAANTIDCTASSIAASGNVAKQFTVTPKSTSTAGTISHTATVTAQDNPDTTTGNNAATASFVHQYCGDGSQNGSEGCDPGTGNFGTGANQCRTGCVAPTCGDGIIDGPTGLAETCDQGSGNVATGDGCDGSCHIETDWICSGAPSTCQQKADLQASLFQFSPSTVYAGGSTSLQIKLKNLGPAAASTVVATFTKVTGLTYSNFPAACTDGTTTFTCSFSNLAANAETAQQSITVVVAANTTSSPVSQAMTGVTHSQPEKNATDNAATTSLTVQYCGDGAQNGTEQCDTGGARSNATPNACRLNCVNPSCGDGVVDTDPAWGSETCDDGNGTNTDDCPTGTSVAGHPLCKLATCGDGYVHTSNNATPLVGAGPLEGCDDGDGVHTDNCPDGPDADGAGPDHAGTCQPNTCGDGFQDLEAAGGTEGCDDGNKQNGDACPDDTAHANAGHATCVPASCGDSYVNTVGNAESCDDGNGDNNDACPDGVGGSCFTATCGDGFVNFKTLVGNAPKEDCDQRNDFATGDGCTGQCHLEPGFTCVDTTGPASQNCTATCGVTYAFTPGGSAPASFLADSSDIFQFGATTKFGGTRGWVTKLSGSVPASTTATLAKSVAIQASSAGRAPKVEVDVQTDGEQAGDCLELHVDTQISTAAGTLKDQLCFDGTKTLTASLAVDNALERAVVVTLVYKTAATGNPRVGAIVKAFRYVSDADNDGVNEVKGLACSDACVDGDGDLYGDVVTSADISLCTGAISKTKSDCNDRDAAIKPNIDEVACTDGVDNNCDGKVDGTDQYCFEICGDFIENGKKLDGSPAGNGIDCADPQCNAYSYTLPGASTVNVAADAFCATPCLLDWSFSRGPILTEDGAVDDVFEPLPGPAVFGWTTGPTSDATRKVARLQFTIPSFGGVAKRGPAPKLLVDFALTANVVGKDIFAVCIENKTCVGNTLGITKLAETSTAGSVTGSVDLTPWLGNAGPDGNLDVTFLLDTFEPSQASPVNVNLDITRVRLASDVDGDPLVAQTGGYEGTPFEGQAACDPCWDADKDGYGEQLSPDVTKCCFASGGSCTTAPSGCAAGTTDPRCFDCNDDPTPGKGQNAHPPLTADEGLCGDGIDNNCNTFVDAADTSCGTEDCANGVDDNGDFAVDCADSTCANDKACSPCETSYEFEKGRVALADSNGFASTGSGIFEWGRDPLKYGGAGGWWTVKAGNLSLVQASGPVLATLSRAVTVPTGYEQPTVELAYELVGGTTFLGVCIDKPVAVCNTDNPQNLAWSTTTQSPSGGTRETPINATYRAGGLDHTFVPIGKGGHTIVIVFQSSRVDVDGIFLDAVRVRSDIDRDGKGDATGATCDHCIDFDGDGYGTNVYGVSDLSSCPVQYKDDCDDADAVAYPRLQKSDGGTGETGLCFLAGGSDISDDDCDGLADPSDSDCNSCGDGRIGAGETCDPPTPGECSAQCQLLDNTRAFVSELHFPILFGRRSEQWIELYNPANQDVDMVLGQTKIMVCADAAGANPPDADRSKCRFVSFVDEPDPLHPGQTIPAACQVVSRSAMGHVGNERFYVISFGPANLSDFRDSSVIDAVCDDPSFTMPTGSEWLVVTAAGADLDKVPMSTFGVTPFRSFDDCLFEHDIESVHGATRGRSIVLRDVVNQRAPSNNAPESWCLAGRDQDYSTSGGHFGSPGSAGTCAEVLCDGVDDDCSGDDTFAKVLADEGADLAPWGEDADGDGVCDAEDCKPADGRCTYDNIAGAANPCVDDADGDLEPDCSDTCFDVDGDGYGSQGQTTTGCAAGRTEAASCDGDALSNPGLTEATDQACTDDRDNDCDGQKNCLDSGCAARGVCAGETCAAAQVVTCGFTTTFSATSDDFPVCDAGPGSAPGTVRADALPGKDKVFKFVAPSGSAVTFKVENLGSRRHELFVAWGGNPAADDSCSESSCASVEATSSALCADAATVRVASPTVGETYTVVAKAQGTCNLGTSPTARLTVVCAEDCAATGVDEDKDGLTDCADTDCALAPACRNLDQDGDGFTSAQEITCLCAGVNLATRPEDCTAPRNPSAFPSEDDVKDVDGDSFLNCVDDDDDGDLAKDVTELALCKDPGSKNNKLFYPTRDLCSGPSCGPAQGECCNSGNATVDQFCRDQQIDANCNGAVDTTEAAVCGTHESNCGDNVDDDFDGSTDCDDFDCVRSSLCGEQDADGDCVSNRVEVACNTNPTVAGLHVATNPCAGGAPGCSYADEARFKNDDGPSLSPAGSSCPADLTRCEGDSFQITASDDTLTFLAPHGFALGDFAVASQITGASGLANGGYYVQAVVSTTKLKLSLTKGGPVINVTSDGAGLLSHACVTDDVPNCADDDDDGDLYDDVQEVICGSDPLVAASLPPDLDGDRQCDDVDQDEDGDGFDDILEVNCALDGLDADDAPRNALSTPRDELHDIDGDGVCNNFDDDDDGDTWTDIAEKQCGTDPDDSANNPTALHQDVDDDKLCDKLDTDDDGDGWSDIDEAACTTSPNDVLDVPTDTDRDRQCDAIDTDDDNDGVDDTTEIGCHTDPKNKVSFPTEGDAQDPDSDHQPNCIDTDDDGDLVTDANEKVIGSDPLKKDTDGDGLEDGFENANKDGVVDETETSPVSTDSDDDGVDDLTELNSSFPTSVAGVSAPTRGYDRDSDDDGLLDGQEDKNHDGNLDAGETNPLIADSDGDGHSDGDEVGCATDPLQKLDVPLDRDQNGECDGAQVEREDCDKDGVADGVETFCGFDKCNAASTPSFADLDDSDGDGDINCVDSDDDDDTFTDVEEGICGTKPRDKDSRPSDDDRRDYDHDGTLNCADSDDDNDGLSDVKEGQLATNAQDADSDDDGLNDGREVDLQTNPLAADTDGDGVQDGTELGVTEGTVDTAATFVPDADPTTTTQVRIADSDGDGLPDGDEDTNHNGRVDEGEGDPLDPTDGLADTDNDGLIDRDELKVYGTDPNDPDTDDDALDDKLEVDVWHTDPNDPDSDDGGVQDGFEVENGTNPMDKNDDYNDATVTGDNVFGCGAARDVGMLVMILAVGGVLVSMRRRARGGAR